MIYTLGDRKVETADNDYYVAPDAQVIGSVHLGRYSSVWFNCVLRGDNDLIVIGEGTNIQDGSIIHADAGVPTELGRNVSVGHRVLLHGCTIDEETLIANGAMVLDRARIGKHCLIAAGALIPPGKVIPDGSVVMGMPGKVVREINERDLALIAHTAEHYRAKATMYRQALAVDPRSGDALDRTRTAPAS